MSRSARAYRDELEPIRPEPVSDLPLFAPTEGEAARDRVLQAFEDHRPAVVKALREEAHRLYQELGRPISANDVRPLLALVEYHGDPRILVAAFPLSEWEIVGETKHDAPGNHARRIRTYQPKDAT